ncbi:hypothetical protein Tco_0292177 [Tanacetum coccineum]
MDEQNMTMEEYIKFEEEKARRRGRVFNWQTVTYGKVRVDDDIYNLRFVKAEFPAIVIDDTVTPQDALLCESQVSTPVNDEIDFRISFDESNDEDYTIIYDINSFSYKMIYVINLITDSENNNEKSGIPSFPPPKPTTSYIDDLDFLNDFENEFPAIVYNDAQTSKLDLLTEPILNPRHIDKFNLNDETSMSEYDEQEQNILKIGLQEWIRHMALPPREQRHRFLRVPVFNFGRLSDLMTEGLTARMLMEHRDDQGVSLFTSRAWRTLFYIRGPLVHELILDFSRTFRFGQAILDLDTLGTLQFQLGRARSRMSLREFILALGLHTDEEIQTARFGAYWAGSARQIPDKGDLRDYWMGISYAGDFLGTAPSYTMIRDPILRLCHRLIACSITGRSQAPKKVTVINLFYLRGMDVDSVNVPYLLARLAEHFRLLTIKILGGLKAWVAMGPERHPDAAASALAVAEDAPTVDEGDQAVLGPVLGTSIDLLFQHGIIRTPFIRMVMEHHDEAGVVVFTSQAPENVSVTNLFYLRGLDVGSVNIPYLLIAEHFSSMLRILRMMTSLHNRIGIKLRSDLNYGFLQEDTAYPCLHSPKTTNDEAQYAISRDTQYAVFNIWNKYSILEDIKRGPYSKKSPICRIQLLGYADGGGVTAMVVLVAVGQQPEMRQRRVEESEYDERVDRAKRNHFGLHRKTPPEKFFGGGDVVAGGGRVAGDGGGLPEFHGEGDSVYKCMCVYLRWK